MTNMPSRDDVASYLRDRIAPRSNYLDGGLLKDFAMVRRRFIP